jgi:hypothetical protein
MDNGINRTRTNGGSNGVALDPSIPVAPDGPGSVNDAIKLCLQMARHPGTMNQNMHVADHETCVVLLHVALSLRSTTVWSELRSSIVKTIVNIAGEDISETHLCCVCERFKRLSTELTTLELIPYEGILMSRDGSGSGFVRV